MAERPAAAAANQSVPSAAKRRPAGHAVRGPRVEVEQGDAVEDAAQLLQLADAVRLRRGGAGQPPGDEAARRAGARS